MQAAEALKLTGEDMKGLGLVDDIVPEPLGGAHADREATFTTVKSLLTKELDKLQKQDATNGSTPVSASSPTWES